MGNRIHTNHAQQVFRNFHKKISDKSAPFRLNPAPKKLGVKMDHTVYGTVLQAG